VKYHLTELFKRACVGVGTVSRMLNNSGYVAEETREKIEIAMRELNYTPNELAVKFVAYDGTFITEMVEPKMTAVVQPIEI